MTGVVRTRTRKRLAGATDASDTNRAVVPDADSADIADVDLDAAVVADAPDNLDIALQPDPGQLGDLKRRAEVQYAGVQASGTPREIAIFEFAMEQLCAANNTAPYEAVRRFKRTPVTIDEFIESDEFLDGRIEIWPALVPDLRRMNPDVLVGGAPVHEALLGGATCTGKTTLSIVTALYQVYLLTCFRDVQALYGLSPQTPIVFMFQSLTPAITQRVIYKPFRDAFEAMPYAQRHLNWNRNKQTALEIEGGIVVVPELANVQSITGQAIAGGILDEVNFMVLVENSQRIVGPRGQGGKYDQAEQVYRNLSRRRKSRFATRGYSIGCLCILSSTRYVGDFLDRRIAEVDRLGEENVVVVRHKQYEVRPSGRYSGETFRLLVGGETHPTRILGDDEAHPDGARIESIPIEYQVDFQRDPENALRDIVGLATDTISPFIAQRHKIVDAIMAGREQGLEQWVDKPDVTLEVDGLPQWNEAAMPNDRDRPRFIHVDLSVTGDRCGIAIVKFAGMANHLNPRNAEQVETLPTFVVETAITIKPSRNAELDIGELRTWLVQLATYYDFNIAQVSYDGYQSRESLQALRRAGIRSCEISVDRTLEPYLYLRSTLYHDRLIMVESEILRVELVQLELNAETNKVDHPPRGSKDLADAVCGAVYGASQSRLVRSAIGYRDPDGAPAHRPGRGERPKRGPRPSFGTRPKRITAASIKQDRYDYYRALSAQEDEEFRNRYDGGNK